MVRATRAFGDGAVVLIHTWTASALEALPQILEGLRGAGARFVTVDVLGDRDLATTANPETAAENPA